ncbi:hypothetical protein [Nocardia sp. NPDC060249]|uniref:hypothetical protein n=1 Tax=Nocardia sp. NPDC060249 TaxID=3347082 RepID=UPI00364B8D5B
MTAEEIRAEVIERLAIGQFDIDELDFGTPSAPAREWAKVPEMVRQRYRADAARLVDALGDLLPTGVEEGGRCDVPCAGCECDASEPCSYSADPNVAQKLWGDSPRLRRYITDWKPVTA